MKSLTVMLTAALMLCLAPSAGAYPDVRSSDSVVPIEPAAPASQDLRSPDSATRVTPTPYRAPAAQDLRSPDTATPAVSGPARGQGLRSPDTVTPVAPRATAVQDLRSPDAVTPVEPAPASAATSSDVTLPVDGGLSGFMIVLISLGGAVALAGAAYTSMRLAHHRSPAA
jgi:hypothetical protein